MLFFISGATRTFEEFLGDRAALPYLGAMLTPNNWNSVDRVVGWGVEWCIDNACFDATKFSPARFLNLCERAAAAGRPPVFVCVPDVVGDHGATTARFAEWLPKLKPFGLPLAFVTQDGLADPERDIPWDEVGAVFIGGSDTHKEEMTTLIADEARRRSRWCHLGRVNSRLRFRRALFAGCHSIDGSAFSKFPKVRIPMFLRYARQLEEEAAAIDRHINHLSDELARHVTRRDLGRLPVIDPTRVTNFNRTEKEVHEFLVFAVCVAGKQSNRIARAVAELYQDLGGSAEGPPFLELLARLSERETVIALHRRAITPHTQKGAALHRLAVAWRRGELDLRSCPVEQLESFKWVGAKTARFFVLHTQPNVRAAVLDTHVLKFLRSKGYKKVPKASPSKGSELYRRLEEAVLTIADKQGMTAAEFDLGTWKSYAKA